MPNQLNPTTPQPFQNFVIFKIDNAKVNIDVFFHEETLWLTQKQIAELFEKGRSTVSGHLKNIFEEELIGNAVVRNFRTTAKEYNTNFYNLVEEDFIKQIDTTAKMLKEK